MRRASSTMLGISFWTPCRQLPAGTSPLHTLALYCQDCAAEQRVMRPGSMIAAAQPRMLPGAGLCVSARHTCCFGDIELAQMDHA
jgi:hypothetical protein